MRVDCDDLRLFCDVGGSFDWVEGLGRLVGRYLDCGWVVLKAGVSI